MSSLPFTSKVEDSVPKVDGAVAVGENLEFQRKWWSFENGVWCVFLAILVCDVLGLFGRGWLAKAQRTSTDGALTLHYERIERASTPSIMTLDFGEEAIHRGHVQVFVSDSVVKPLGAQRISPQPESSAIGNGGILYSFPALHAPMSAQIQLEPSFPGVHPFRIQVTGSSAIDARVLVVP
ncbi:MAG TPA: hypothetical protein VFB43_18210 [Terracidiphilus sp.]|jgi:hypothetical protein|nr:hypothetical protein [Terracidiphilus sp.]